MYDYSVIAEFKSYGKNMLVVRMSGAACIMEKCEYKKMVETQKRNAETSI